MTNGVELHVRVVSYAFEQDGADPDNRFHTVLPGYKPLVKAGFEPFRKACKGIRVSDIISESRTGVFADVCAEKKGSSMEEVREISFSVVDPGQIHAYSFERFRTGTGSANDGPSVVTDSWRAYTGKAWENLDKSLGRMRMTSSEYETHRRAQNSDYHEALNELSRCRFRTSNRETFETYCRTAWTWNEVMFDEQARRQRRYARFDRRIALQRKTELVAQEITKDVDCVFFGTGCCRAKGHKITPVKPMIKAIGRLKPTFPVNEWGTSSRCPHCKQRDAKVKRVKTKVSPPDESTTLREGSNTCGDSWSGDDCLPALLSTSANADSRMEKCSACGTLFPHDQISTMNMSYIADAKLHRRARPCWLSQGPNQDSLEEAII